MQASTPYNQYIAPPPKVFISYSHDSPSHKDRVRALADRLREEGIEAWIDQYSPALAEGWPIWMEKRIQDADFVLLICTETYLRRVEHREEPGKGRGVLWEAKLIYNLLYAEDSDIQKFIPVIFAGTQTAWIPLPLRQMAQYPLDTEAGYEDLYRHLTGQPHYEVPVLGKLRALPAQKPASFIPSPDSTLTVQNDVLAGFPGRWRAAIEGFLTQYLGPPECPAPFGGRGTNLDELDQWLAKPETPRYALIAARGGIGKSALLAHWVNSLQTCGTRYALVYHPISARWQTNSASAVFQSLAFRLAAVFGEPLPDTQDNEQLREVVLQYIEKANRESKPLLIVVDGLDEAAGWEADTRLFPPSRRGSVRILVSARPLGGEGPREWLNRLGWHQPGIAHRFKLDLLDKKGIADVLHRMGNPLAPLSGRLDIVETVFRKSEGDPLLVGLYLNKLREYVSNPETFRAAELDRIEPGLAGFFRYWLSDQEKLWGSSLHRREPGVRTLLGLCSIAHGPLNREDVRALAPEKFSCLEDVEDAARDLSRFVLSDARADGLVFGHPRFGDFVREELIGQEERAEFERRFVECGIRLVKELAEGRRTKVSEYVVRWHTTHLRELGRPLDDFRLLLNFFWYQECERVDGTPAQFLGDLNQAWAAAQGVEGLGARVRITLLRSSLITLGRQISRKLFESCVQTAVLSPTLAEVIARQQKGIEWSFLVILAEHLPNDRERLLREALEAARQIGDSASRSYAQLAMAERLEGGDREKVLREALEAARQIGDEGSRSDALIAVAERLEGGDRELLREALETARQIVDEGSRSCALSAVAARLEGGDREKVLREALEAARQIGPEGSRSRALSAVAARLAGGDRERVLREALKAARQIGHERSRSDALRVVAERLEGDERDKVLREALEAARQIGDEWSRSYALSAVAERLEGGDREKVLREALEAARQIGHERSRSDALSVVAERLEGDERDKVLREVLEAARQIGNEGSRSDALSAVAARLEGGDRKKVLREALNAVCQIGDKARLSDALRAVAARLEGGDRELLREALEAARQIGDERSRSDALSAVAGRLEGGDRENVLREALETARQIGNERSRSGALSAVAARLEGGDRELLGEALEAARQIGDQESRSYALRAVAARLAGGDRERVLREALEAARQIGDERSRSDALSAVAGRLEGDERDKVLGEALEAARQIGNEWSRSGALSALAERLEGDERDKVLREALEAARQIGTSWSRSSALSAVAARLEGGDRELLGEALEVARQIGDKRSRSDALRAVAARLDAAGLQRLSHDFLLLIDQGASLEFLRLCANQWDSYAAAGKKTSDEEFAYWLEPLSREVRSHLLNAIGALLPVIEHLGGQPALMETANAISDTARWWR